MKRGIFLSSICAITMIFILLFPKDAIASASGSFNLWMNSVFPSLFPFFVLTSILKQTGTIEQLIYHSSKKLDYNLLFTTSIGLICGYPSTSKLIGSGDMSSPASVYAISTCASPVFLIGTVCTVFLGNINLAVYLLPATYLSLFTSFFIIKSFGKKQSTHRPQMPECSTAPTAHLLTTAILDGLKSQGIILGIITITGILALLLEQTNMLNLLTLPITPVARLLGVPKSALPVFFKGLLEMTSGISSVSSQSLPTYHKLLTCGFLSSFGGMSIILESLAFLNEKIKATTVISIKLLHACLTYLYLRLLLYVFPLVETTSLVSSPIFHISGWTLFYSSCILCFVILLWLRRIARPTL